MADNCLQQVSECVWLYKEGRLKCQLALYKLVRKIVRLYYI